MNDTNNQPSILTLFPQAPTAILTNREMKLKILRLLNFFVSEIIESLRLFYIEKRFDCFDPHVGDTLCQIRAYQNLLLTEAFATKSENAHAEVQNELQRLETIQKKAVEKLAIFEQEPKSQHGRNNRDFKQPQTISELLEHTSLLFSLSTEATYLIRARMLTIFNQKNVAKTSFILNYEQLAEQTGFTKAIAYKLLHKFQCDLASTSCDFINALLSQMKGHDSLKKMLPLLRVTDNCDRHILPGFEVTKILFTHFLKQTLPILFVIHRYSDTQHDVMTLLVKPNSEKTDFQLIQQFSLEDIQKPGLIIEGKTIYSEHQLESRAQLTQRLLQIGILKVIFANMARHPQYSSPEFISIRNNPYRLLSDNTLDLSQCRRYQKPEINSLLAHKDMVDAITYHENELREMQVLADQQGCQQDDSSLLLITHIFCDTIQNYLAINPQPTLEKIKNLSPTEKMQRPWLPPTLPQHPNLPT